MAETNAEVEMESESGKFFYEFMLILGRFISCFGMIGLFIFNLACYLMFSINFFLNFSLSHLQRSSSAESPQNCAGISLGWRGQVERF